MANTDFDLFLEQIEDLEDAFCLDQTIRTGMNYGSYYYDSNDERVFISSDCWDDTLMLASDKARDYFLKILEEKWSEEGIPLDIYYEMKRQMAKND